MLKRLFCAAAVCWLAAALPVQAAKENTAASAAVSARERQLEEIGKRAVIGPKTVDLGAEGRLNLPKGMKFIGKDDANVVMEMLGNPVSEQRYGVIFPDSDEEVQWWFDLLYVDSGYIKDDDAKDWDVDGMLQNLKDGTAEQNKVRQSKGIPEIEIAGWIEKPTYDAAQHRLVWSVDLRGKNAPAGSDTGVNYNTFLLGRKGFISLMLITDGKRIEQYKPMAKNLLENIEFKEGLRYTDFDYSTDKVAEYGLAALVGGAAAKKLGLFAMLGAFLAKFGKVIALGGVALMAVLGRFFKRKKRDNAE